MASWWDNLRRRQTKGSAFARIFGKPGDKGDQNQTGQQGDKGDQQDSPFGSGADPDKDIKPPDIEGTVTQAREGMQEAHREEVARGEKALADTGEGIEDRYRSIEEDIRQGMDRADRTAEDAVSRAEEGQRMAQDLPEQVQRDLEQTRQGFEQQTAGDVDRVEGIGREAVAAAVEGKNAAAQAAVEAQQNSVRDTIANINANPDIPQSRKTAMIEQVRMQGAMSIASTVGKNIKDFTQMETDALSKTANNVGSMLSTQTGVRGQLAAVEMGAMAQTRQAAVELHRGFDQLALNAQKNRDQMEYNYNQMRASARTMQDQTQLKLLGEEQRVAGMPLDYQLMDYGLMQDALMRDFGLDMQARGMAMMEESIEQQDKFSRSMLWSQIGGQIGGPIGAILGYAPALFGGMGSGAFGGGGGK